MTPILNQNNKRYQEKKTNQNKTANHESSWWVVVQIMYIAKRNNKT